MSNTNKNGTLSRLQLLESDGKLREEFEDWIIHEGITPDQLEAAYNASLLDEKCEDPKIQHLRECLELMFEAGYPTSRVVKTIEQLQKRELYRRKEKSCVTRVRGNVEKNTKSPTLEKQKFEDELQRRIGRINGLSSEDRSSLFHFFGHF